MQSMSLNAQRAAYDQKRDTVTMATTWPFLSIAVQCLTNGRKRIRRRQNGENPCRQRDWLDRRTAKVPTQAHRRTRRSPSQLEHHV